MIGVLIKRESLEAETCTRGKCHVNTGAMLPPAKTGTFLPNMTNESNKNDLLLIQTFKTLCFNHSFSEKIMTQKTQPLPLVC